MQCKKFLMLSVKKFSIGKRNKSFPYVVKGFSMLFVKEFDCFPQKSLLLDNRFLTVVFARFAEGKTCGTSAFL